MKTVIKLNYYKHYYLTGDALKFNNGMKFSTKDKDNDNHGSDHCAREVWGSGWWFNTCSHGNLNGIYNLGVEKVYHVYWISTLSKKKTGMMIK